MDVRNCKGCSRLFNYIGGQPLCPECSKALDVKFDEVRDYVYDHPRAGIQQVAEENDVTIAQIKRWIREERLAFSDDAQVGLECEGCGKMIRTGRFCEMCKTKDFRGPQIKKFEFLFCLCLFLKNNVYLFIWPHQVLVVVCGLFSDLMRGLSFLPLGLVAPRHMGS